MLREVIRFPVDNLRAAAKWNTRVCFAFLYDFLTQIKRILNYLPEGTFLRAEREPGGHEFKLAIVRFSSDDLDADRVVFFGKEFAVSFTFKFKDNYKSSKKFGQMPI